MVRVPTSSGRGKVVHFGDSTMQDFTQHKDTARRERYRSRHQRDNLDDPGSPGFWSWYALWGQSSSITTSFADAARRAKRLGGARRNPDPLHDRFAELCDMINTPARLVIDEETALAGRDPRTRRAFAATDGDTVYVRPKLAAQPPERIDAVLMHELGHVILIQHGYEDHTERDCDECAEGAFGVEISYDADDVQTLGPGVRPRPAHLDLVPRHNPSPRRPSAEKTFLLFCYGSNNPEQLRQRIGEPKSTTGAYAPRHKRVFRGRSKKWNGGVASLVASTGRPAHGYVAEVTESQLALMDQYEGIASGNYTREFVPVVVDGKPTKAIAYVSTSTEFNEPSDAYLEAVLKTIAPFWQVGGIESITVE